VAKNVKSLFFATLIATCYMVFGASPALGLFDGWRECSNSGGFYISGNRVVIDQSCSGEAKIPFGATEVYVSRYGAPAGLTSIRIPSSVKDIGLWPSPPKLNKIDVDSKNKKYSSSSGVLFDKNKTKLLQFPRSKSGSSYTIPATVKAIEYGAFSGAKKLKKISFAKGSKIKAIQYGAFSSAGSLEKIHIPDSVVAIEDQAFDGSRDLKFVTFGPKSKLKSIGALVLSSTDVNKIVIPASVTTISDYAFDEANWLQSISVDQKNKNYSSSAGVLFNKKKTFLIMYPGAKDNFTYTIPSSVMYIKEGAFYKSTQVTNLAFSKESKIKRVCLCSFADSSSIKSLSFPASVETITDLYNNRMRGVESYTVSSLNKNYLSVSGVLFNKNRTRLILYPESRKNLEYVIPASVVTVAPSAFSLVRNLRDVTFASDSKITTIGDGAFSDSSITKITIPANVISIGNSTFDGASRLVTVTFDSGSQIKSIGSSTFKGTTSLRSITIPPTVTSIGNYAFESASRLVTVTFDSGSQIKSIGFGAFKGTSSLRSITIPSTVTSIGNYAFESASLLDTITFMGNAPSVGDDAFFDVHDDANARIAFFASGFSPVGSNWQGLKVELDPNQFSNVPCSLGGFFTIASHRVVSNEDCTGSAAIPEGTTAIWHRAFLGASELTSITIPSGVSMIGNHAFFSASSIESISIPSSVEIIGDRAFANTLSMSSIYVEEENPKFRSINGVLLNNAVTSLIQYPIGSSLTIYELPSSVSAIENAAFNGATNLRTLIFMGGPPDLGDEVFGNVAAGSKIQIQFIESDFGAVGSKWLGFTVEHDPRQFSIESCEGGGGYLVAARQVVVSNHNCTGVATIPAGVKSIVGGAFRASVAITAITIPASVTSIENGTFDGATSLKTVTFAEGSKLTSIGQYAFQGATSLTSINIPSSVTSIGQYAFQGATSLTSINIPSSVTSIGDASFDGMSSLLQITVNEENKHYSSYDDVLFDRAATKLIKYPIGRNSYSFEVPASVISINNSAFQGASNLFRITFQGHAPAIGINAFRDMPVSAKALIKYGSLGFANIGGSWNGLVVDFDPNQFQLESCSQSGTFRIANKKVIDNQNCMGNAVIPSEVTSIATFAFAYSQVTSLSISASVKEIERFAFEGASELESVTFAQGSQLTSLGVGAFSDATSLSSITIPSGVTSIEAASFSNATSLSSITIPSGVTSIGVGAFAGATSLSSITIPSGVTAIEESVFKGATSLSSITIPSGVTSIGDYAFEDTSSLTSINIPSGVNRIGIAAFSYSALTSIIIPANVTYIGTDAFFRAGYLTSVYFEGNAPTVGNNSFSLVASGAKAYVSSSASGFGNLGRWNGLVVVAV
jgi:hypothetical protein